ncbi:MAG: hypothetical protein WB565_18690 [Acidimicrobiales bacterium]
MNANGGQAKYRALQADRAAERRALRPKRAKLSQCRRLRGAVERKLEVRWSPQQISSWLAETYPEHPEMQVSHETIYQSLFVQGRGALRKELHSCLRTGRAMRRAKAYTKGGVGQGQLTNMVCVKDNFVSFSWNEGSSLSKDFGRYQAVSYDPTRRSMLRPNGRQQKRRG